MRVKSFDVSHEDATAGIVSMQSSLELKSLVEFVRGTAGLQDGPPVPIGGEGACLVQVVRPTAVEYDVVLTEKRGSPIVARDRIDARMQTTSTRKI